MAEVSIGSRITIKLNDEIKEFEIVGSAQVDAAEGRISYLSPIGEALLGRRIGEAFKVELPSGKVLDCKIVEISE